MKRIVPLIIAIAVGIALFALRERTANVEKPNTYDRAGLSFQYPRNWKVTEDSEEDWGRYLLVESPGDAIFIIQVYAADDALEISEYAEDFARSAREETPVGNVTDPGFGSVETEEGYEVLTEHFSVSLVGETVPHTRAYRRKAFGDKVCFLIAQVADEDRSKVIGGFDQVISTFRLESP